MKKTSTDREPVLYAALITTVTAAAAAVRRRKRPGHRVRDSASAPQRHKSLTSTT